MKRAATDSTSSTQHLERVVKSVTDATKRLSQQDSITTTMTKSSKRKSKDTVGPWKLGKTLGKGSSGRVRLAKNMKTGQLAAIKIVPKRRRHPIAAATNSFNTNSSSVSTNSSSSSSSSSSASSSSFDTITNTNTISTTSNPYGIEREIVIMKLISHPNVMGLYEVWENKSELYLVLEYVDGGELFDYLVSKGRLPEREAVHYFKQIIQGVSFCHSFNICHRDLKPENLLLDKKNKTIKIADFGMAALEISNKLLKTSCGSPHYASPEIVMGKSYHGGPCDVWSCGIILFALLTGHLPFNDDNIKKLLLKVQSGKYQIPNYLSKEAKDLIAKILVVDPSKRITTLQILRHPLITKYASSSKNSQNVITKNKSNLHLNIPNNIDSTSIVKVNSSSEIDDSIVKNLQILWHGASKELIIAKLLQPSMTEEKIFYSLLWQYKQKTISTRKTSRAKRPKNKKVQKSLPKGTNTSSSNVIMPTSIPPSLPIFTASSSRSFKNSSRSSSSHSLQKESTNNNKKIRTLANSESKRSLYSLQSISKRSLNLNEYLNTDKVNHPPPLPADVTKVETSDNEFELLCDQILFGNGLEKIMEEEYEDDHDNNSKKASEQALKENISTASSLPIDQGSLVTQSRMPLNDITNRQNMLTFKKPGTNPEMRIASEPNTKPTGNSLDPRRNFSNPTKLEAILHSSKPKRKASLTRTTSNLQTYMMESNKWVDHQIQKQQQQVKKNNIALERVISEESEDGSDILAHSSTIQQQQLLSLPSTILNSHLTFKNLTDLLQLNTLERAPSTTLSKQKSNGLKEIISFANSLNTTDINDLKYMMEIPSRLSTAQLVKISNGSEAATERISVQQAHSSVVEKSFDAYSTFPSVPITAEDASNINIFENAPMDADSMNTMTTTSSSSDPDLQPNVHKKAVSIDTLNTTHILTPQTDVRVSLYVNINTNGSGNGSFDENSIASDGGNNVPLARETTEEILGRYKSTKISSNQENAYIQKRFSTVSSKAEFRNAYSKFQDAPEDSSRIDNQEFTGNYSKITKETSYTSDRASVKGRPIVDENILLDSTANNASSHTNRVTMLFDDESDRLMLPESQNKQSDLKIKNQKTIRNIQKSQQETKKSNVKSTNSTAAQKPPRDYNLPSNGGLKLSWFNKFFSSFKPSQAKLVYDHDTNLSFDVAHNITIVEFNKNGIDYKLKHFVKNNKVKYDCTFIKGNFKFKIEILKTAANSTRISVRKRERAKHAKDEANRFLQFNKDIDKVIKTAERVK